MRETLRVHGAAIEHELPQRRQAGFREEGAWSSVGGPYLQHAALQHGLHRGWDLRLIPLFPTAPGAQEDAVRNGRVLAEVTAQLAAEQFPLGRGERDDGTFGSAAHRLLVTARMTTRDLRRMIERVLDCPSSKQYPCDRAGIAEL